tara:strand:- start:8 stop:244 length:237 start_codon:yes stop_codon:yes gene_type:complete
MAEKTKISNQGYRLEYKMGTRWNEKSMGWYIDCKSCGEQVRVGSDDIEACTCSKCVSSQVNSIFPSSTTSNFEDKEVL